MSTVSAHFDFPYSLLEQNKIPLFEIPHKFRTETIPHNILSNFMISRQF